MAITSADISALPDYTDAELLKLYRWAMANGAAGQSRSINGRSVSFPSARDIMAIIGQLEARVNAAEGYGGSVALGSFGDPV
jgi:hypothetical protein